MVLVVLLVVVEVVVKLLSVVVVEVVQVSWGCRCRRKWWAKDWCCWCDGGGGVWEDGDEDNMNKT